MLVLSRKLNQKIMIGDDVCIVIVSVDRDQVKIGIEAPRNIAVHRWEVYEEIKRSSASASEAAAGEPRAPGGDDESTSEMIPTITSARKPVRPKRVT